MKSGKSLVVFEGKNIRRNWYRDQWYFSIIDVIAALDASSIPKRYWSDLKKSLNGEGFQVYDLIVQLKLTSSDGKKYSTDCANTENMFRIIQSIPSRKAEPFKQWLAKVGYERTQEIENPELAQARAKQYYELKGYPKNWIEKRIRGISIRQELTDEWKQRGISEKREYSILTNEISEATFGLPIKDHKKIKSLDPNFKNQNLRDHMTDFELIFSMLGEKVTTEITRNEDSDGFTECKSTAKRGGKVAGKARLETEKEIKKKVVSKSNYLDTQDKKQIK